MSRRLKIILAVFFGIIIACAFGGWLLFNKPHKDVKDAIGVKITATELYNSFLKDSVIAKTKYVNKIVEASGEVIQISKNQQNQTIILLKTAIQNAFVNCTMEGPSDYIKPNTQVSLKGICNGFNGDNTDMGIPGDVLLIRCYATN
jgi:hypothetical protein